MDSHHSSGGKNLWSWEKPRGHPSIFKLERPTYAYYSLHIMQLQLSSTRSVTRRGERIKSISRFSSALAHRLNCVYRVEVYRCFMPDC
jgi:hypothetical protein